MPDIKLQIYAFRRILQMTFSGVIFFGFFANYKPGSKYSFTNANLAQYTGKGNAYIPAQRFFVEYCIKDDKRILEKGKYQTHNLAPSDRTKFLLSTFVLKAKAALFL